MNYRIRFLFAGLFLLSALSGVQAQTKLPWFTSGIKTFLESGGTLALGWSKDGTVALLAGVDTGGRGGSAVRMVLVDAVEDEVLFDSDVWSDEVEAPWNDNEALAVAMAASPNAQNFLEKCVDAEILPVVTAERQAKAFPLVYQGSSVTARAVVTPRSGPDDYGARVLDYKIVVSSRAKGEKTVASSQLGHAYEVAVEGYFLSPWEPRMLVASWYSEPGYEGERPITSFFSGCHLNLGFKK